MSLEIKAKEALALFEQAVADGWINREEYRAIAREVARANTPEQADFVWHRLMDAVESKAPDPQAKQLLGLARKLARLAPSANPEPSLPAPARVFFTPGMACHDAVIESLAGARKTLEICVFTITHNAIAQEIVNAARRNVAVRIITDDDKAHDAGSDIFRLAGAGLNIRTDHSLDHMHHKFAIADRNTVMTGSLNWTHGAAQNLENLIILKEPPVVQAFIQEFEKLWQTMAPVDRNRML